MFKFLYLLFFVCSVSQYYSSNLDSSAHLPASSAESAKLRLYSEALFHNNEKFDALINTETKEVFYSPKSPEFIDNFLLKVVFTESLCAINETSETVRFWAPIFAEAKQSIIENRIISELHLRSIFAYLSALKDSTQEQDEIIISLPDIWDWISEEFHLPYALNFEKGVPVIYAISDAFIENVENSIPSGNLSRCFGFKIFTNEEVDVLNKALKEYTEYLSIDPLSAPKYINFIRLFDEFVVHVLSSEDRAREFVESTIKPRFQREFGIVLYESEVQKDTEKETRLALAKLVGSREINDYVSVGSHPLQDVEKTSFLIMRTKDYFTDKIEQISKLRGANPRTVRAELIGIQEFFKCRLEEANRNSNQLSNATDREFSTLNRLRFFKDAGDSVLALMQKYRSQPQREVRKTSSEPPKKDTTSSEDKMKEMLKAMGLEEETSSKKPLQKPKKAQAQHHNDDDEVTRRIVRENALSCAGMKTDSRSVYKLAEITKKDPPSASAGLSKHADKRVARVEASMQSFGSEVKKQSAQWLIDLIRRPNYENINFYNQLQEKTRGLKDAETFEADFFHRKGQPKYEDIKSELSRYNFMFLKHPRNNVDYFCWKIGGKLHFDKVDIPHGAQLEKGKSAGWFLRMQQKITQSGLVLQK